MSRDWNCRRPGRVLDLFVTATLVAVAVMPVLASPAQACSCAMPTDIQAWVDDSEAAFVGTLVDRRDAGGSDDLMSTIYVFEVEEWVKGDLGDTVEVRSAPDGAGCGFEFFSPDQRIGAIIFEENGHLNGGLCSQLDADVLLAAMEGPTPSRTGIGRLLTGNGWSSTRLTALDDVGAHVIDLYPPGEAPEFSGTQQLDVCPSGDLMLQLTPTDIAVWDLERFDLVTTHDISGLEGVGWVNDIDCRSPDASSIYVLVGDDFGSKLMEVVPELTTLIDLEGLTGTIGSDYVISQDEHEGDATWVDIASGERVRLTETPPDELRSISVAPHPTERRVALVETRFGQDEAPVEATLSIVDESGAYLMQFDIPWETYSPTWLDDSRVSVQAYDFDDWETSFGFVYDLDSDVVYEIEGWSAEHTIAAGDTLYGVNGGDIMTTDLATGEVRSLVTLASQSAGPLVLLDDPAPSPVTTTSITSPDEPRATTPPLVAPGLDDNEPTGIKWLAGTAIAVFIGILVWLGRRPGDRSDSA